MATTAKQDKDFISQLIPHDLLEQAIEFIAENFAPEEVFTERQLENWVAKMGLKLVAA